MDYVRSDVGTGSSVDYTVTGACTVVRQLPLAPAIIVHEFTAPYCNDIVYITV